MKDLSITIVAYHDYNDIKAAVASIEAHTNRRINKTVYIVDNGAQDANAAELAAFKRFLAEYPDAEYLDAGENRGFGGGHNFVMNRLQSRYHAIVNPDILLKSDAFQALTDYMDAHPEAGMCIPNITDESGKRLDVYRRELTVLDMFNRMFLKSALKKRAAEHTMADMDYEKPFQVPFGQGSFLVIRTELFRELGGFDERYFMYVEDADLCRRVNERSKLMYVPGATVIHKWEKGSHKNKTLLKYHLQSTGRYFKKWGYKWK